MSMCQIEGPRSCVDWERGRDAQTPTKGLAVAAGSEWRSRTPRLLWSSDTNLEKLRTFERKTLNSSTVWVSSEKLTFKTVVKRTYPCLEAPTSSLASALVTGVTERGRGGVGVRDSSSLGCTNSPGPLVRLKFCDHSKFTGHIKLSIIKCFSISDINLVVLGEGV